MVFFSVRGRERERERKRRGRGFYFLGCGFMCAGRGGAGRGGAGRGGAGRGGAGVRFFLPPQTIITYHHTSPSLFFPIFFSEKVKEGFVCCSDPRPATRLLVPPLFLRGGGGRTKLGRYVRGTPNTTHHKRLFFVAFFSVFSIVVFVFVFGHLTSMFFFGDSTCCCFC